MTERLPACVLFALLSTGCEPESIVIARGADAAVDSATDATQDADATAPEDEAGTRPGPFCTDNSACAPDFFCAKQRCGDASGSCQPMATVCNDDQSPVCGCDGVTYFNDCLRRQHGASLAVTDVCGQRELRCSPSLPCPRNGHCALLRNTCGPGPGFEGDGQCWVMPDHCRASGDERWAPCAWTQERECVSACEAIKLETPHGLAQQWCGRDRSPQPARIDIDHEN